MIFSKLISKRASFAVMIIACLCFVAVTVVNLGMPIGDLALQLLGIVGLILILIGIALLVAFLIRFLIHKLERPTTLDESEED